jgi:hypothetical protein
MTIAVLAVDRIDTWVFRVSMAIPVVCLAGLVLWHLVAYLARKLARERKVARLSPEPPARPPSPKRLPGDQGLGANSKNDPEQLERACAALAASLAGMYLELADSWLRQGQPQRAALVLQQLMQSCPDTPEAQLARDRLRDLGAHEGPTG